MPIITIAQLKVDAKQEPSRWQKKKYENTAKHCPSEKKKKRIGPEQSKTKDWDIEHKDGRQVRKQSGETWPERPSGLVRPASSLDDNAAGKRRQRKKMERSLG